MKQELIEILSTFGYPVRLQGSLGTQEAYPKSFFTIWNDETEDYTHYDNAPIAYVWTFSINFYSVDPILVNTVLIQAKEKLKESGWIIGGKGYDVPSDEASHTGRAITALYIEKS